MNAEKRITPLLRKWKGQTVMERFMSKIDSSSGCWLWMGPINRDGYGKFTVRRITVAAHRFAYQELISPIPDGLTIDHLCKHRNCVNPAHMEPVTMRENLLRGDTIQARNHKKTHCLNGHPFDDKNTIWFYGWRQCRECLINRKAAKRRAMGLKERGRYKTKCS